MTQEQLLQALQWRYAVKKFDATKKISDQTWSAIEKAMVLTPSSYGLQPWKFLVIQSQDVKDKLTPVSWNQAQVFTCSHYVVLLAKRQMQEKDVERFVKKTASVREMPVEGMLKFQSMMIADVVHGPRGKESKEWATRQAYIALGNLMTVAAVLDVDACPMEGIEPSKYDEILGLADSEYTTVVACALGYRSADDKYQYAKKVRYDAREVIEYR